MSNENLSNPHARKISLIIERRRFISQRIQLTGKITEQEIGDWLEATKGKKYPPENEQEQAAALKTFRTDMEFLRDYEDRRIFEKRDPVSKQYSWIDETRPVSATRSERLEHCYDAKSQIGELLLSLLLGFHKFTLDRRLDNNGQKEIEKLHDIKEQIRSFYLLEQKKDPSESKRSPAKREEPIQCKCLLEKLNKFWESRQRALFLDAGTTTHIFARDFLQYCPIPMYGLAAKDWKKMLVDGNYTETEQAINGIDMITNDRHIFNCVGASYVEVRTIMVGGVQQYRSAAVAGNMAERFLETNRLTAGMAIIATSDICLNHEDGYSYICTDNEPVGSMKIQFMERSQIRIVVADSSKINFKKHHLGWRVCAIQSKNIDMVITETATEEMIKHFREIGVPLIAYNSPY